MAVSTITEPKDYPYRNGKKRSGAGRELLKRARISDVSEVAGLPMWEVSYDGKTHKVVYKDGSWSCDCEDQKSRAKGGCKHIWTVYLAMKEGIISFPEEEKGEKKKNVPSSEPAKVPSEGFVGPQKEQLSKALEIGLNVLLKGPTGTGKTVLVREVVKEKGYLLGYVAGSESLQDIDFLGAYVKKGDSIEWVDGKLTKAFRLAQKKRVILFIDEINRIPSKHLNILIGVMNPVGGQYVLYNHLTGEEIKAPVSNLRFIGAMNEGGSYQVHPLDPALARRFGSTIRFTYLPAEQEAELIAGRTGIDLETARKLVEVANLQREATKKGEFEISLDTASLLVWAQFIKAGLSPEAAAETSWVHRIVGSEFDGSPNEEQLEAVKKLIEMVF